MAMQIRQFRASQVNEAMRIVKKSLGSEAIILARRDVVDERGVPAVEITAAVDADDDESPGVITGVAAGQLRVSSYSRPGARTEAAIADLATEVAELKRAMRQLGGGRRRKSLARFGEGWVELYDRLCARGLLPHIACELVIRSAVNSPANSGPISHSLAARISSSIPVGGELGKVKVLVGATGGGKTTTVAKLAARLATNRKVGLVMGDSYRVGAGEQLGVYAKLLDLPMKTVSRADQLVAAVEAFKECDDILVDTTGQSGSFPEMEDLTRLVNAIPVPLRKVICVVSATTDMNLTAKAWRRFESLCPDLCVATKLDEAGGLARVYNWLWEARVPLAYLGTGQRVPNDLEPATGTAVAKWVLGGNEPILNQQKT